MRWVAKIDEKEIAVTSVDHVVLYDAPDFQEALKKEVEENTA